MGRDRLQRSVDLVKDETDTDLFGRASYLLGFCLVMTGEFDEGIYHLHTAYDAVIDSGRPSTVARTLTTIGRFYGFFNNIRFGNESLPPGRTAFAGASRGVRRPRGKQRAARHPRSTGPPVAGCASSFRALPRRSRG